MTKAELLEFLKPLLLAGVIPDYEVHADYKTNTLTITRPVRHEFVLSCVVEVPKENTMDATDTTASPIAMAKGFLDKLRSDVSRTLDQAFELRSSLDPHTGASVDQVKQFIAVTEQASMTLPGLIKVIEDLITSLPPHGTEEAAKADRVAALVEASHQFEILTPHLSSEHRTQVAAVLVHIKHALQASG